MSPIIPEHERGAVMDARHAVKPARSMADILDDVWRPGPGPHGGHPVVAIDPLAVVAPPPTLSERITAAFAKATERARRNNNLKTFTRKDRNRLAREMREQADQLERQTD